MQCARREAGGRAWFAAVRPPAHTVPGPIKRCGKGAVGPGGAAAAAHSAPDPPADHHQS